MWILWKMRLWNCEFCQKWRYDKCGFCQKWGFQNVNFRMNLGFLPQCAISYFIGWIGWNWDWSTCLRSVTSICQSRRATTKTRRARLSLRQNQLWDPQRTSHHSFRHNLRPKRHWRAFATGGTLWPCHPDKIDPRSIDSQLRYERGCRLFRARKWMGSWLLRTQIMSQCNEIHTTFSILSIWWH